MTDNEGISNPPQTGEAASWVEMTFNNIDYPAGKWVCNHRQQFEIDSGKGYFRFKSVPIVVKGDVRHSKLKTKN